MTLTFKTALINRTTKLIISKSLVMTHDATLIMSLLQFNKSLRVLRWTSFVDEKKNIKRLQVNSIPERTQATTVSTQTQRYFCHFQGQGL